jgi:hypothetical protein
MNSTLIKTDGGESRKDIDDNDGRTDDDKKRKMVDALVATCDGMDVIEAGLIQRLKQCQLYGIDKPMDVVTAQLTEEHIRALKVSSSIALTADQRRTEQKENKKKRSRHAQVQTLPWDGSSSSSTYGLLVSPEKNTAQNTTSSSVSMTTAAATTTTATTTTTTTEQTDSIALEELQQQLAQERQERQRLEAALETTCDHFEVLSGLAYKKLRELWEEKLRWENACIELNDRLVTIGQGRNSGGPMDDLLTEDLQHSDFIVG